MKIGVDVDEVLASLFKPLMHYHNDVYGTKTKLSDVTNYDLTKIWGGTMDEAKRKVVEFYETTDFLKVLPVEGAVKGISKLHKEHELIAITSRPPSISKITNDWIDNFFSNKFQEVHLTNSIGFKGSKAIPKSEVCKKLNVGLMIDDHLAFVNDCASNNIPSILFNKPWNQANELHSKVTRVNSWQEIVEHIQKLNK